MIVPVVAFEIILEPSRSSGMVKARLLILRVVILSLSYKELRISSK